MSVDCLCTEPGRGSNFTMLFELSARRAGIFSNWLVDCGWESSSKVSETFVRYSVCTAGGKALIGSWNCCEWFKDDGITDWELLAAANGVESVPENDGWSKDDDPELHCNLKASLGTGLLEELTYCDILSLGRAVWGCTLVVGEALSEVFWFVGCSYEAESNGNDIPKIN